MGNPHYPKDRLTAEARQSAREKVLEDMLEWYIQNNPNVQPELHYDNKAYNGKTLYWLSPAIPGLANPVMIEEFIGDHWTLRIEPSEEKIRVFT